MDLSTLPDDILVRIGTHVGELCGIQEFLSLSTTCKRLKELLIDKESTVSEVIRLRTSDIHENTSAHKLLSASGSSSPAIRTLKELVFFESLAHHKLFDENRIYARNGDILDYVPMNTTARPFDEGYESYLDGIEAKLANQETIDLIQGVQTILRDFPSAKVHLEAHSGTQTPGSMADMYSTYRADVVKDAVLIGAEDLEDRLTTKGWGSKVIQLIAESKHPYHELALQGNGWVEVYLRLPTCDGAELELPPRLEFYAQTKD